MTGNVVRVAHTGEGDPPEPGSPVVVAEPTDADWSVSETGESVTLATGAMCVELSKETCALTWRDADGDAFVREPPEGGKAVTPVSPADLAVGDHDVATPADSLDREAYSTSLELEFDDDEAVLGLGQHEDGVANYSGEDQVLYQANTKVAMPAIVSTKGYGVLWDTGSIATFHDDASGTRFWTECDDALEFYVAYGPELDDVVAGFRYLTGESAMVPKWAYGYVQSKERYEDADELVDVVDEYRDREVPLDCIVQDWQYWPDTRPEDPNFEEWGGPAGDWGQWGQKSFHPGRYPDPSVMTDALHDRGVRLMISVWPNALAGENYEELRDAGQLLDDEAIDTPGNEHRYYDVFDDEARETYWRQAKEGLFDHGVDAWWCDSTEPYDADWTLPTRPDPTRRATHATDVLKSVLDPGYVNTFSLFQAKGMYEGQRAATDEKRVINLTRSGYPGQHRYGAITWSGDVEASWDRFAKQIADGLQFTATGNPKWTLDVGGFFVADGGTWNSSGNFEDGHEDAGYRELYTRWFQYGAFLPMFRSHGTNTPREVWRFGEPGDRVYDTLVRFDELRYRLLPYLYSLAGWETHDDYTMYRHLAFDFREDQRAHDVADQFMLGPAFMVCPVTEPMYHGPDSQPIEGAPEAREVYLPGDGDWYDFWTGRRYTGGQTILADAPLERMPLFIRAGSVVPMGPVVQHTGERPDAPWTVRAYPGRDGAFDVYEDAGDGYGYEAGEYAVTPLRWDDAANELAVGARDGDFPDLVTEREIDLVRVAEGVGIGVDPTDAQASATYDGAATALDPRGE